MYKLFVNNIQIGNYDDMETFLKGVICATQGHNINMEDIVFVNLNDIVGDSCECHIHYSTDNDEQEFDEGDEVVYEGLRCKVDNARKEWIYDLTAIGKTNEELCENFYSIPQEFIYNTNN